MFGFSLTKLLFTAAVIAVVWYGFKIVGRLDRLRKQAARNTAADGRSRNGGRIPAEDMIKCPVCDLYVTARSTSPCDRGDCPY